MQNWFKLSTAIVDREDLSIYEKMCCVVLARFSENENDDAGISIESLALSMGVEEIIAKGAFYSLMSKNILELADKSQILKPGTIIKAKPEKSIKFEEVFNSQEIFVESRNLEFTHNDLSLSRDEKIQRVCDLVDEKISNREATIILSFANNDIKKIIDKYKIAKASQYKDKIEVLINELQKKDVLKSNVIKKDNKELSKVDVFNREEFDNENIEISKTQINTYQLNLMRKYKKK